MNAEHTPTPWCVEAGDDGSLEVKCASTEMPRFIATAWGGHDLFPGNATMHANAEFIVRACNSHADLLAALKAVVDVLQREAPGTPLNNRKYDALGSQARAAIAKAEATDA